MPGDYKRQPVAHAHKISGGAKATTESNWLEQRIVVAITIPPKELLPNQSNKTHWAVVGKARKAQRQEVGFLVKIEKDKIGLVFPWAAAIVEPHVFYRDKRWHADEDAICHSLKGARDGIQDARLVINDNTISTAIPIISIDKENPRIELWITRKEENHAS
jgi:hypothetical protein